jgi:hypothetical protein
MRQPSQAGAATKKHVILFLAANPPGTPPLLLDREVRSRLPGPRSSSSS